MTHAIGEKEQRRKVSGVYVCLPFAGLRNSLEKVLMDKSFSSWLSPSLNHAHWQQLRIDQSLLLPLAHVHIRGSINGSTASFGEEKFDAGQRGKWPGQRDLRFVSSTLRFVLQHGVPLCASLGTKGRPMAYNRLPFGNCWAAEPAGSLSTPSLWYISVHECPVVWSALHCDGDRVPHFRAIPTRRRSFEEHSIISPLVGPRGCRNGVLACGTRVGGSRHWHTQDYEARRRSYLPCLPCPVPWDIRADGSVPVIW